jgi:hypothetical protein
VVIVTQNHAFRNSQMWLKEAAVTTSNDSATHSTIARWSAWIGLGLLAAMAAAGCTSDEEKAMRTITKAVEECRSAEVDGTFYEVELFEGKVDEILPVACDEEITDFEMTSKLSAHAYTGPVRWGVRIAKESGVWTLYNAEWSSLQRARNAASESDPSEETLGYAESHFKQAQKEAPGSAWIRLERLQNLLDLRAKSRKHDTPDPVSIGEDAQKQYEETLAFAEENDDLDTKVEAQYLVAQHISDYKGRIDTILSSDGSSDEWLVKAAEEAEKEGDDKKAEEYRQELADQRAKRQETHEIYTERREETMTYLCEQLSELQPTGVSDTALQKQVVGFKESIDCMAHAAKDE